MKGWTPSSSLFDSRFFVQGRQTAHILNDWNTATFAPYGALSDAILNSWRYGQETIEEAFYTVPAWRGLFFAVDLQHVNHPGYNKVRGPVTVPGVRMHLEF